MNSILLSDVAFFHEWNLVLADSAVKGAALLVLAALAALVLRRDSAATRHLVWLLAIVAMLAVPVLSAVLPQWRVLPRWAGVVSQPPHAPQAVVAEPIPPAIAMPVDRRFEIPRNADRMTSERATPITIQPAAAPPLSSPVPAPAVDIPAAAVSSWSWSDALPLMWAIGFCVLVIRLLAARAVLWKIERRAAPLCMSGRSAAPDRDTIATANEAACLQLGIRRPIAVLIHQEKTIPMVWGLLRQRLLLPAAARSWSGDQLRSVLLHELAHVKRGDMLGHLLAQIACALHWFNPLMWLAAWRLGVERERACDDLVLAAGVRPSVYAEHLLDVATRLSPVRWTRACELVMARKPSLEGRLVAVLSENGNRRAVSAALAAIALAITLGIAVPAAMLRAADEKPGKKLSETPAEKADKAPGEKPKTAAAETNSAGGEKLDPVLEKRLRWGEPSGGLRAAIAIRPAPGKPKRIDLPNDHYLFPNELYLAVQNVSGAPIRLNDTTSAPDLRELLLKLDGELMSGIVDKDPTGTDVVLRPREVVFLLMFAPDAKNPDNPSAGAIEAEDAIKDARQTMYAKMRIAKAPPGAWTGKLRTGDTDAEAAAGKPQPKNDKAQALFKDWQANARTDGKIPGPLVARLGARVKYFISLNKDDNENNRKLSQQFEKLLPRFDASRDWTQPDAIALLDDVSAINAILLETTFEDSERNKILTGDPLPANLADAPWGQPSPDGLRAAWLLEPRTKEYPLDTPLKSRILVYNSGNKAAIFIIPSWQQSFAAAYNAKDAAIKVSSKSWTTIGFFKLIYRLAPGEYCETAGGGVGIGVGAKTETDGEEAVLLSVGTQIDAKPGEDVRLSPGPVQVTPAALGVEMMNGRPLNPVPKDATDMWERIVTERVGRELPFPAAPAERTQIIHRVTHDLFGNSPTPEEMAAFVNDKSPTAEAALIKRLQQRPGIAPFMGTLTPGDIRFRVLPADLDAAKRTRVATGPGFYFLGDNLRLSVERTRKGYRRANTATILFYPSDSKAKPPGKPYEIELPDGLGTYAIAWQPGAGVLWVKQKWTVGRFDFSNPAQVKETTFEESASREKVPKAILDAMPPVQDVSIGPPASASPSPVPTKKKETKAEAAAADATKKVPKPEPKGKEALALFNYWQGNARTDGKIPGALLGGLAARVKEFISANKRDSEDGRKLSEQFEKLLPRFDTSHDWTQPNAIALLDDVSAIHTIPLETTLWDVDANTIRTGEPLPADLASAPWGRPSPDGLRVAWALEPRAKEYQLRTSLGSRILVHNSGKKPVVFIMPTWQPVGGHVAPYEPVKGQAEVRMGYTTLAFKRTWRLLPGEYCASMSPGIGIGAESGCPEWIAAKAGDEVRFLPNPVDLGCSTLGVRVDREGRPHDIYPTDATDMWRKIIAWRVGCELPLPSAAAERTQIIGRVTRDLFSEPPTPEEIAAFVNDKSLTADAELEKRLLHRPGIAPFMGALTPGDIRFRVLPAEPKAANKVPRPILDVKPPLKDVPSAPPGSASPSPVPTKKKETKAEAATRPLAEVVKAINEQAAKLPETRRLKPLTEDEVVAAIEKFQRPAAVRGQDDSPPTLTDDQFRAIKSVAQTRRLPDDLVVRQFVRYDVGTGMEHGWWVRLNFKRQGGSPTVALRQDVVLQRPYTQLERQFRDGVRRTGQIPTMGRTMAYFDEDPQVGVQRKFSAVAAEGLAEAVKQAINDDKAGELLKLYCWDKVDAKDRMRLESDARSLLKRKVASVVVRPRGFGGRLTHWENVAYWDPNVPLAGYIELRFADPEEPKSLSLEFGETAAGARLANYFISRNEGPKLVGKRMSRGFSVRGFTTFHPDKGWQEFFDEIDTPPDEMPALKQVNFEIWKVLPK